MTLLGYFCLICWREADVIWSSAIFQMLQNRDGQAFIIHPGPRPRGLPFQFTRIVFIARAFIRAVLVGELGLDRRNLVCRFCLSARRQSVK